MEDGFIEGRLDEKVDTDDGGEALIKQVQGEGGKGGRGKVGEDGLEQEAKRLVVWRGKVEEVSESRGGVRIRGKVGVGGTGH